MRITADTSERFGLLGWHRSVLVCSAFEKRLKSDELTRRTYSISPISAVAIPAAELPVHLRVGQEARCARFASLLVASSGRFGGESHPIASTEIG
jgi:hypothetical protein